MPQNQSLRWSLWPLAVRQPGQVVLAGVRDDDLARRVVDRLDLVIDGRPAEPLRRQHRDGRDDVAGARERPSAGREPPEPPARRDPDRLAEPELRHVAVERPAVQPVGIDHGLERERRPQRPIERLGLGDVCLDGPVAPHIGLERPDVGVGDLPVALDDLVGVDGHELDAGRCPQGAVIDIDMGVALDRPADAPEPAPRDAASDAGQSKRSAHTAEALLVRATGQQQLERSIGPRQEVGEHRRADGRALRRDGAMVEAALDETGLMERPDDDRDAGQGIDRGHRPGRRHRHGLQHEDHLDIEVREPPPDGGPVLGRGDLDDRDGVDGVGEVRRDGTREGHPVRTEGRAGGVLPERPVRVDDPDPRSWSGGALGHRQSWW